MSKKRILALLVLLFSVIAIVLCFLWYSWKLALILFIWQFANNLDNIYKKL